MALLTPLGSPRPLTPAERQSLEQRYRETQEQARRMPLRAFVLAIPASLGFWFLLACSSWLSHTHAASPPDAKSLVLGGLGLLTALTPMFLTLLVYLGRDAWLLSRQLREGLAHGQVRPVQGVVRQTWLGPLVDVPYRSLTPPPEAAPGAGTAWVLPSWLVVTWEPTGPRAQTDLIA